MCIRDSRETLQDLQDLGPVVALTAVQEELRYHPEEVLRPVLLPSVLRCSYGRYEVLRGLDMIHQRRPQEPYGMRSGDGRTCGGLFSPKAYPDRSAGCFYPGWCYHVYRAYL